MPPHPKRMAVSAILGAVFVAAVPGTALAGSNQGRGYLLVCNHTGYLYGVFADGPSIRTDDLAGDFDECTQWWPVRVGRYEIGYGKAVKFNKKTVRVKRTDSVSYTTFGDSRTFHVNVQRNKTTRVDLGIPSLP